MRYDAGANYVRDLQATGASSEVIRAGEFTSGDVARLIEDFRAVAAKTGLPKNVVEQLIVYERHRLGF